MGQQQQQSALTRGFYTAYFDSPINTATMIYDQVQTTVASQVPAAYIISKQWTQLIELLHLHGVQTETLDRDRQFSTVVTRLLDLVWEDRPFKGGIA